MFILLFEYRRVGHYLSSDLISFFNSGKILKIEYIALIQPGHSSALLVTNNNEPNKENNYITATIIPLI